MQEPRLLIFDEPTGNLDIANEELIIDEAKKAARQRGVAILSSLHDLNQALCLGDKFFLLRDGAVRYAGDESVLTSEVIGDIFDIQSRIINVDGKKVFGSYKERRAVLSYPDIQKISAVKKTSSGLKLYWRAQSRATFYDVYRKTKNSTWKKIGTVSGRSTTASYEDKTAKKGTTYYYAVRAGVKTSEGKTLCGSYAAKSGKR